MGILATPNLGYASGSDLKIDLDATANSHDDRYILRIFIIIILFIGVYMLERKSFSLWQDGHSFWLE